MDLSNEYVAKSITRQLLTAALRMLSDTVKVHRWLGHSEVHSRLADIGSLGLLVFYLLLLIEGSLEAKLPTIWTDEKQSREEAERRERLEERRSEKRKSQKKEDADARKGRNVVKH